MDTAVLERMVKIMSYMRGSGSKPGKLRKKDKLRMLQVRSLTALRCIESLSNFAAYRKGITNLTPPPPPQVASSFNTSGSFC